MSIRGEWGSSDECMNIDCPITLRGALSESGTNKGVCWVADPLRRRPWVSAAESRPHSRLSRRLQKLIKVQKHCIICLTLLTMSLVDGR
ncbi:hypothetical protein CDAR_75751 [Caerostris darwini]|uniref:Uncharacterized protein n=1 Tax=Caerostris darwini TaxID=1538125 RepID=A0AAV4W2G5_9ARAC|nr:hypothetical protein CDAR_75751 [Caerostris darwini]